VQCTCSVARSIEKDDQPTDDLLIVRRELNGTTREIGALCDLASAFGKLGVANRTQAALAAGDVGVGRPPTRATA